MSERRPAPRYRIPFDENLAPMIPAGDSRLLVGGKPLPVDVRILSEENFQRAVRAVASDGRALRAELFKEES